MAKNLLGKADVDRSGQVHPNPTLTPTPDRTLTLTLILTLTLTLTLTLFLTLTLTPALTSGQLTMDDWVAYIKSKGEQATKVLQLYYEP